MRSIPRPAENLETTNTGTVYQKQEDGSKVIASSRRPDGTYRKPIRVREGYTPLEENVYKGPEVQQKFNSRQGPPGYHPDMDKGATANTNGAKRHPPGYNPGQEGAKGEMKPKPANPTNGAQRQTDGEHQPVTAAPKAAVVEHLIVPSDAAVSVAGSDHSKTAVKPENRMRNLKKKLAEISALEERVTSEGEAALPADLKQKLERKAEYLSEIAKIERTLAGEIEEEVAVAAPAATVAAVAAPAAPAAAAAVRTEDPEEALKALCPGTKPENRVRNLRKKLGEITALEEKVKAEGQDALSEEQKQKMERKAEYEEEVETIECLMAKLHT